MSISNKNASTEDQVGKLHNLVTKAFTKKVEHQLDQFDNGNDEDKDFAIDDKTLAAASKWVQANEITCMTADKDGKSELAKKIAEGKKRQKSNVLSITGEDAQYG